MEKVRKRKSKALSEDHSIFTRPCDGKICRICLRSLVPTEKGITVCTPVDRLNKLSASSLKAHIIRWDKSQPSNVFHFFCWDELKDFDSLHKTERTTLKSVEESVEVFDSHDVVDAATKAAFKMISASRYTVCFTGAGVSASCGIPTYRGAEGIDTLECHTKKTKQLDEPTPPLDDDDSDVNYRKLEPSNCHRHLVTLHNGGHMDFIITQNCDNLHAKAGFPRELITDLHGNVFVEYCERCEKEYTRKYAVDAFSTDCYEETYYVQCPKCKWNHYTGRKCTKKGCEGKLRDTIVNFGDDLHQSVLGGLPRAEAEATKADVCLAMGTSLSVYPANTLPLLAKKLIIVNPQVTDFDDSASVRLWTTSDVFMDKLMILFQQ